MMRDTPSLHFDAPEIEALWITFLSDLDLIEGISAVTATNGSTHISVTLLPLGQFRPTLHGAIDHFEEYSVFWLRNGVVVPELDGMFEFSRLGGDASGEWIANVRLKSSQIRVDHPRLQSSARVAV
jgi:hypothetical protein